MASRARAAFSEELDQLSLQVELMAVRVDENLERMRTALVSGAVDIADRAVEADDAIDLMRVSLTERCYDLLRRESPVASDLRLVVSVLRVVEEVERIGDLCLRVVKLTPDHALLASNPASFDVLVSMADDAVDQYRASLHAWSTRDLRVASAAAVVPRPVDLYFERLLAEILRLTGDAAVAIAVKTFEAGRAIERIVDHTGIITARVRYLLTGDPSHIASEVR